MEIEHRISKEAFETVSELFDLKFQVHRQLIKTEVVEVLLEEIRQLKIRIEKLENKEL